MTYGYMPELIEVVADGIVSRAMRFQKVATVLGFVVGIPLGPLVVQRVTGDGSAVWTIAGAVVGAGAGWVLTAARVTAARYEAQRLYWMVRVERHLDALSKALASR